MKISKKPRGHLAEKVERNKAIIALYICGFSQWAISRLLHTDRWNVQKFIRKYKSKYLREMYHNIADFISDIMLKEKKKSAKKGGK